MGYLILSESYTRRTAIGCDFNRSMQHLISKSREEDVADEEVPTEDSLHRSRQEHDVRWRKGDSLESIAQLFDRTHGSVARILRRTGGIRPPKRMRSGRTLSLAEREEISRGVVAGQSLRSIAASLKRAPSTVSREINRNGGRQHYRANVADQAAWNRSHRPKTCKLIQNPALARIVANQLQLQWSPRQIAGWLKRTYPDDETYQVSHETIYRTLFIQARGALKKELLQHLRHTRRMRHSLHHTQKTADRGRIKDTVSISERPAEAEDRAVPGHWEGDLLFGSKNSQIATLVERHTRLCGVSPCNTN